MSSSKQPLALRIEKKLRDALAPQKLDVIDESHLHEGHAGSRLEGETHYRLFIVAEAFEGDSRIARQRRVNAILQEELAGSVHALAMKTLTPSEERAPRGRAQE